MPNKGALRYITVAQSITLFEIFNMKQSYGKEICPRCRRQVGMNIVSARIQLHNDALSCLFDPDDICCVESDDIEYAPLEESASLEDSSDDQRTALNNCLEAFGNKQKIFRTENYTDLSHRVKLRYVRLMKFLVKSVASFMAEKGSVELIRDVYNDLNSEDTSILLDGNFCHVLGGISEAYSDAESWHSRREILSIVAPKISLKLLQLFIPGLTADRFTSARLHAKKYGVGTKASEKTELIQRFSESQVAHFVDFIISPHVCTDLPFGEKILKLSSGSELYVPNTIRNMGPTRIADQYLRYCREMCANFRPLGETSLFRILEACKASTRKSLQGINYFAAEAAEAFDGIKKMIENNDVFRSESNRLLENLKRTRLYLKSDFRVHVAISSNVRDHCCTYALSDPKRSDFAQTCDHDHNDSCHDCSNITNTLDEIRGLLEQSDMSEELLDRSMNKFLACRESIEAWKAHLLRSINQDSCREKLLDTLSDDTIYLYLDWAMKFLPMKSREAQSDFFGKRGISWHITVVMKRSRSEQKPYLVSDESDENSEESSRSDEMEIEHSGSETADNNHYEYKVFVHIFDQCTQDSETVLAIIRDVLGRVKSSDPGIRNAFIRSDNAGCYHSTETIASVVQLADVTGIRVQRIDFCDSQGGKGPCDRYAAVIKSNVRRYLNENHNVTSAAEFVEACHSYRGVKGVLAINCRIEKESVKKNQKFTMNQITNYYNFEYRPDGVLVHRAWNVGSGLLVKWSSSQLQRSIREINTESVGYENSWVRMKEAARSDESNVSEDTLTHSETSLVDNQTKAVYECDVQGCTSEFLKFGNLMNHIMVGKHHRSVERFSLADTAMKFYHCKLEDVGARRMISIDLNIQLKKNTEIPIPLAGWALPMRKPKRDFTVKIREYLTMKFNEGVSGMKHWKPKDVAADMENLKENNKFYFSSTELLTESQIRSFFSRMKRARQAEAFTKHSASPMDIGYSNQSIDETGRKEQESDEEIEADEFQDIELSLEENEAFENALVRVREAFGTSLP